MAKATSAIGKGDRTLMNTMRQHHGQNMPAAKSSNSGPGGVGLPSNPSPKSGK
jgi:hypothetical protein